MNLHLQTIPARQGLAWIRHGFTILRKKPLAMTSLWCSAMVVMLVLPALIPPLQFITPMLLPMLGLGFMLATHMVLQGQTPNITVFAAPFRVTRERRRQQLLLGLAYGLSAVLIGTLAMGLVGDSIDHVAASLKQAGNDDAAMRVAMTAAAPDVLRIAGIVTLMQTLLSVPFWHAPALVHWGGQGLAQAVFSSTLAVWRNRGAYLLNALGWLLVTLSGMILMTPLVALLGSSAMIVAVVIIFTAYYSSLYFGFVDCFLSGTPDKLDLQPPAPEVKAD
ncbi:BPSS1780 family membrane protein [Burkholderiaceae bacterium UC74_6]